MHAFFQLLLYEEHIQCTTFWSRASSLYSLTNILKGIIFLLYLHYVFHFSPPPSLSLSSLSLSPSNSYSRLPVYLFHTVPPPVCCRPPRSPWRPCTGYRRWVGPRHYVSRADWYRSGRPGQCCPRQQDYLLKYCLEYAGYFIIFQLNF